MCTLLHFFFDRLPTMLYSQIFNKIVGGILTHGFIYSCNQILVVLHSFINSVSDINKTATVHYFCQEVNNDKIVKKYAFDIVNAASTTYV